MHDSRTENEILIWPVAGIFQKSMFEIQFSRSVDAIIYAAVERMCERAERAFMKL